MTIVDSNKKKIPEMKLCLACNRRFEDASISHCPHDSTQLILLGANPIRVLLSQVIDGKYEPVEVIGKGASGTVLRATLPDTERHFAIKLLSRELYEAEDPNIRANRFSSKMSKLASLSHPGLISVYDFGLIDKHQPFIVMELLDGVSLASAISQQLPSAELAASVIASVADAMDMAHKNDLLHEGIKPSNIILLPADCSVKVIDFETNAYKFQANTAGLAEFLAKDPIHYMSPESLQGKQLTPQSDIFSLGIVLFETLTGKVPFKGENIFQTANLLVSAKVPLENIPEKFHKILSTALEKLPTKRYKSMGDMRDDLRKTFK